MWCQSREGTQTTSRAYGLCLSAAITAPTAPAHREKYSHGLSRVQGDRQYTRFCGEQVSAIGPPYLAS
jgi:hypothetical protein